MGISFWHVCFLILACRGARAINVDRIANQQSDLVRQTFQVIEDALEAQYEMFDERIKELEGRLAELEQIIAEGGARTGEGNTPTETNPPVEPPVQTPVQTPKPVKPKPKPKPEPHPEPEPQPEPEPEPQPEPAPTDPPPPPRRTTSPPVIVVTEAVVPEAGDPHTCQEAYNRGETTNGVYTIDPLGLGRPFEVECEFADGNGKTIVSHDLEAETKNNNNRDAGSFQLIPTYQNADMEQLGALADASGSCEQFVKLRCKSAVLFQKKETDYGWWVSRTDVTMRSWGGVEASTDARNCACSIAGNCKGGMECNCDASTRTETSDEGLLTDKSFLPVKAVYLGDTGNRKQTSYLTVGKFVCSGTA